MPSHENKYAKLLLNGKSLPSVASVTGSFSVLDDTGSEGEVSPSVLYTNEKTLVQHNDLNVEYKITGRC